MARAGKRRRLLAWLVHTARVALVAALLMAIPSPAVTTVSDGSVAPSLDQIALELDDPSAYRIEPDADSSGMWSVVDGDGNTTALVARTLPAAADVVGYRGPTEASIVFTPDLKIVSVGMLSSADTEEHVRAVTKDESFFRQFRDWPWGGPSGKVDIDAVSGATLTSLALAEGVLRRIGDARPSLVFPDPLAANEIADWFPDATLVDEPTGEVRDDQGIVIGRVLRSGPLSDDVIGYQGPTELLIQLSPEDLVTSIRIRRSFDNQPYVNYVRDERGFWTIFEGTSLRELGEFKPADAGVEGVSGATMTSIAVADTIVAAAAKAARQRQDQDRAEAGLFDSLRWTIADVVTVALLLLLAVLSRRKWFHIRLARKIWLIGVLVIVGFWSGNLISMALIAGWSAEGVAWRLAPGLATIAAVALLFPPLAKSNPYCNHLCPHGAIQQLIKPKSKSRRRLHLSQRTTRWLTRLPAATLAVAYLVLISVPRIDLASWEPFHAYLFRIAGWGSCALAIVSLGVATRIPMAYCRLGCPTGTLIDYLRRSAISSRIQRSDFIAAGMLIAALLIRNYS